MKLIPIVVTIFIIFHSCRSSGYKEIQIAEFNSEKNWQYFNLDKTIFVKVIDHLPASYLCGTIAVASIAIAETKENDTIRILDLCGSNFNPKKNDIVKITPTEKPDFNVILPYRMIQNLKTKKNEPVELDIKILRTIYGNLSN